VFLAYKLAEKFKCVPRILTPLYILFINIPSNFYKNTAQKEVSDKKKKFISEIFRIIKLIIKRKKKIYKHKKYMLIK
jgi:hypothetical protein